MMGIKSLRAVLLFGFLVWLIPFVVSFLIFPLKASTPALFESIMPVVISIFAVLFPTLYFRKLRVGFLREGIAVGII
ncbi:MAG: hypothetical protein Q8O86_14070 [Dehalococcoidia bacterium]|nr:hypothetical protein [Dehalococcoidia bacterium]